MPRVKVESRGDEVARKIDAIGKSNEKVAGKIGFASHADFRAWMDKTRRILDPEGKFKAWQRGEGPKPDFRDRDSRIDRYLADRG